MFDVRGLVQYSDFFHSRVNRGAYQYDILIFEKSRSVGYSDFFCSRVNGGAYPTAKPGFSGVQKSDIEVHG
jgi:hypothetical protein